MGSPAGAPIPIYDANGHQVDFKRDRAGNVVLTKLDEAALEKIAALGNGKYFRATNSQDELDAIYKEVNALQKSEFGQNNSLILKTNFSTLSEWHSYCWSSKYRYQTRRLRGWKRLIHSGRLLSIISNQQLTENREFRTRFNET